MSECRNCGAPISPSAHVCYYCDAPGPAAASAPAPGVVAGSTIEMQAVGPNKIMVIKAVRENALGYRGLKEAKDLVERPMPVRFAIEPTRAQAAYDALTGAGARVRFVR